MLSKVINKAQKDIFKRIYVWTTDEDAVNVSLESLDSGRVTYPYNRQNLDLSKVEEMKNKGVEDLYIELYKMNE